ncbi:hypothetical protein SPFM12_00088 [Salmonella phage SPFM12]|nr:hypothetical protein SPFM12_00088 [Salmonella phage SPFM12]
MQKTIIGITVGSFCGFPKRLGIEHEGFESAVQAWVKRMDDHRYREEITNSLNTMLAMMREAYLLQRLGVDPEKCWRKNMTPMIEIAITRPKFWRPGMGLALRDKVGETPVSILAHTLETALFYDLLPETKANVQWWLLKMVTAIRETKSLYDHLSEEAWYAA